MDVPSVPAAHPKASVGARLIDETQWSSEVTSKNLRLLCRKASITIGYWCDFKRINLKDAAFVLRASVQIKNKISY
jgi:hypothetical protein